ncbi:MAG: outer membrane protein assembly factor BamE [Gammaproteobacteria bacterium]|nr:outer membrane protein assembly factor BamE [Gammaproteobacteria bacterium]
MPKIPRVFKITIQQGNLISQEMIDQLKPGMTRSQVAFIMGEPVARNTFNDDRWDYIYTVVIPGVFQDEKRMSLYFENGVLAYFTGDYAPTAAKPDGEPQLEAKQQPDTASSE